MISALQGARTKRGEVEAFLLAGLEADRDDAMFERGSAMANTDNSCDSFCSSKCCSTNNNCYNTEGSCATVNANTCRCY